MTVVVHGGACVHESARLGDGTRVEDGAVVEADCVVGANCWIGRNSIVWRGTRLGDNNRVFPFCSLGGEPQDKKYAGEDAPLVVGNGNTIREYCFINKGTAASGETRVGNDNWIMAYAHAAHDCVIGSGAVVANAVQLAGHVTVGDRAVVGGGVLFHQYRRLGVGAMVGGGEVLRHDVPPYALAAEGVVSVNVEGMRRGGFSVEVIAAMRAAYRTLYREGLGLGDAAAAIAEHPLAGGPPLSELVAFLRFPNLHLLRPRRG